MCWDEQGLLLGVAARALIERGGRVLLIRRSETSSHEAGLWELPGGKIMPGETCEESLAREVLEETGITVEVGQPFATWHEAVGRYWVTGVAFICRTAAGEPVLSGEHSQVGWFSLDEALAMPLSLTARRQLEALRALRVEEEEDGHAGA